MKNKILIITPRSPFTDTGACEQDRLTGIKWFVEHDFDVRVIVKVHESDHAFIKEFQSKYPIKIIPILYKYIGLSSSKKFLSVVRRLFWPPYWDGASFEYFDKEIQIAVKSEIKTFKPDYAWFDYTYLWPLYKILKNEKIPIITRSINFESIHFLDEDGRTPLNYLRALPKFVSECLSLWKSDYLFAITPHEENIYKNLGKTPVTTLPLRALPSRVESDVVFQNHENIRIGFMPSTYNVHHNKEALRFLVEEVVPSLSRDVREKTTLHVTGSKFPKEMLGNMPREVIYEGFVPSPILFWKGMDIAVSPSLFGAGMQQKIFEPITLGISTITSKRGLAGYPFKCGSEVVCAETKEEVCRAIEELVSNKEKRTMVSALGKAKAKELFSRAIIDQSLISAMAYIDNKR